MLVSVQRCAAEVQSVCDRPTRIAAETNLLSGSAVSRRNVLRLAVLLVAAVSTLLVVSRPVSAQSFFEHLFGVIGPKPVPVVPGPRPGSAAGLRSPDPTSTRGRDETRERKQSRDGGAKLQAMCVRTCDGYYWPVRYPASREDSGHDEALCRTACGTETKVYYRSGPGVDAEEMKDTGGRSYGATPTAFLYRKRLVDGCSCRPMPWTASEAARHERYALIEEEQKLRLAEAERQTAAELLAAAQSASPQSSQEPLDDAAAGPSALLIADATPANSAAIESNPPANKAGVPSVEIAIDPRDRGSVAEARPGAEKKRMLGSSASGKTRVAGEKRSRQNDLRLAQTRHKQQPFGLFGAGEPKFRYPGD